MYTLLFSDCFEKLHLQNEVMLPSRCPDKANVGFSQIEPFLNGTADSSDFTSLFLYETSKGS